MGGLIKLSNFAKLSGYAEMFGQGLAITVMLSIGTVVVGALLCMAYAKTIAKKGSLDKE